jgi:hypothetical protein
MRRDTLHDVAKKGCASRQRTWFLWGGRNAIGGENVKNRGRRFIRVRGNPDPRERRYSLCSRARENAGC